MQQPNSTLRAERELHADAVSAAVGLWIAVLAAIPMVALAAREDAWRFGSALVFALSLVGLHLASTLYHRAAPGPRKLRLKTLDHCAIYVLIAGTYTPFTLIALRGPLGWTLFIAIWSLAAIGLLFKLRFTGRFKLFSTLVYVAMGWLVMVAIKPVFASLDAWTFAWLLAGGVVYTLGTLFYHRPSVPYSHAIWHGFVIGGGICHYVAVLAQVVPGSGPG